MDSTLFAGQLSNTFYHGDSSMGRDAALPLPGTKMDLIIYIGSNAPRHGGFTFEIFPTFCPVAWCFGVHSVWLLL